MNAIVECEHVTKSYGDIIAVNDVNLITKEGEIFGLVGPNGAGKTTLIEMIESLRVPDSGSIRVLGLDPAKEADELHEKIGVQLQTTSIQPNIKVKEAINIFANLYRQPLPNPEELLKILSLEDKADSRFRKLSGGQNCYHIMLVAVSSHPKGVLDTHLPWVLKRKCCCVSRLPAFCVVSMPRMGGLPR